MMLNSRCNALCNALCGIECVKILNIVFNNVFFVPEKKGQCTEDVYCSLLHSQPTATNWLTVPLTRGWDGLPILGNVLRPVPSRHNLSTCSSMCSSMCLTGTCLSTCLGICFSMCPRTGSRTLNAQPSPAWASDNLEERSWIPPTSTLLVCWLQEVFYNLKEVKRVGQSV